MATTRLQMVVNGAKAGPHDVPDALPMIDYLNDYLGLTGTKFGCGIGVCHACVVIVDEPDGSSRTMRTCINGAVAFAGKNVRTIEGHADADGSLSPVQQAFVDHFAFQCGYCTSGFVNEATRFVEALKKKPVPRSQVEDVLEDTLGEHLCRCTGYFRYYAAMRDLILTDPDLTVDG